MKKINIVLFALGLVIFSLTILMIFVDSQKINEYLTDSKTITANDEVIESQTIYGFDDPNWWEHAVFYEIFVRSFNDSNGDGIGDFKGLTAKLDYLNDGDSSTTSDLGITAIWLMPIYPSPSYHGYDVTDYFSINPDFGTMDDFTNFLNEAHKRGIHVILDFVINHTSVEHPWFVNAVDVNNKYHDWYIWSDTDPRFKGPWGEDVWFPLNDKYYYGVFWQGMPDLNYRNSDVTNEINRAASFWINDIGVDGFRIDGARHLIEDGVIQANTKETLLWFQTFFDIYKGWNPRAMTVGEIWDSSKNIISYLKSDSFDMVFNFDLAGDIVSMIKSGQANSLSSSINIEAYLFQDYSMGTFLTNHDMNRVMSEFKNDQNMAKNAATILLTSPGTPFIYYGEEIGMTGIKPDEKIRTPMQWSGAEYAGFTTGNPWQSISKNFSTVNVEYETNDPESLLSHYRDLIRIRQTNLALLDGNFIKVNTSNSKFFAGLRIVDSEAILTLVNLGDTAVNNPVFNLKQGMNPGNYSVEILLGEDQIFDNLLVVQTGEKIEFSLPISLAAHDNAILKLYSME